MKLLRKSVVSIVAIMLILALGVSVAFANGSSANKEVIRKGRIAGLQILSAGVVLKFEKRFA